MNSNINAKAFKICESLWNNEFITEIFFGAPSEPSGVSTIVYAKLIRRNQTYKKTWPQTLQLFQKRTAGTMNARLLLEQYLYLIINAIKSIRDFTTFTFTHFKRTLCLDKTPLVCLFHRTNTNRFCFSTVDLKITTPPWLWNKSWNITPVLVRWCNIEPYLRGTHLGRISLCQQIHEE